MQSKHRSQCCTHPRVLDAQLLLARTLPTFDGIVAGRLFEMYTRILVLAFLLCNLSYAVLALSVPTVPTYEEVAYLDQQQAAAPVGRPDYQGMYGCIIAVT